MEMNRRTLLTTASAATAAAALGMPAITSAVLAQTSAGSKQASGFYRYKIGSSEVTAVTDGIRPTPLADNFVRNQPKAVVMDSLQALFPGEDKERPVFPFTPVVINTGSKLVVIDTGLGPAVYSQSKGSLGQFHTNLAAAGIDRNAVDMVIISHFHGDHIGGLLTDDGKPAFPKAEVLVPVPEWAYWMDDARMNAAPEGARGGFQNVRRIFAALGKQVSQYEAGKEVAPGITAIASPGHTPGHTSHIVASGPASLLVQADITAGPALVFVRNPGWHPAFDTDPQTAEQSRRKLYDMAIAEKMSVQGFHFPFPAAGRIEKDGTGYRFHPAL
jgi:glyoxylase-like metal-dependent hydrolase (beta-lactamase superfamily II)